MQSMPAASARSAKAGSEVSKIRIEVLERAIEDVDFVGAMQVDVGTDGRVRTYYFDLERPESSDRGCNGSTTILAPGRAMDLARSSSRIDVMLFCACPRVG
jgi:hypothetical protein